MTDRSHIAEVLKEAREDRGLSIETAATESGIPLRYVQLLEGEASSAGIPDEFYLIPFFRRYAGFVGLEVDTLLPEFLGQVQQVPAGPAAPGPIALGRPFALSIDNLWRPAAVVLAVALATFLLLRNSPEPVAIAADPGASDAETLETDRRVAAVHPDAAARSAVVPDPTLGVDQVHSPPTDPLVLPAPAAELPPITAQGAALAGDTNPSTDEQGRAQAPPDAVENPPQVGARELRIVATETVWLEVGRDDGPGEEYWLEPGDTRTLRANDSFSLKIGNAGGVDLAFDGRALPPLGMSGQVVRVRLPDPLAHASGG